MRNILLIVLSLVFYTPAMSQFNAPIEYGTAYESDILSRPKPQKGIYQNFDELKTNSPSFNQDFQISTKEVIISKHQIHIGKQKVKNAYGFSDGESIYINARNYKVGSYYVKLEFIGAYALIREESLGQDIVTNSVNHFGEYEYRSYVLNMQTGKVEELTRKKMQAILAEDRELSQAYANEKRRRSFSIMAKYLQAFNEKARTLSK